MKKRRRRTRWKNIFGTKSLEREKKKEKIEPGYRDGRMEKILYGFATR